MTLTTLPTRTIGSLGPTKADRVAIVDPYYQSGATEQNLIRDWLVSLAAEIGVEGLSPAWESYRAIKGGDTFELREPFIGTALNTTLWSTAGFAAPTLLNELRGGASLALDNGAAGVACFLPDYVFARAQFPRLHVRVTLGGNPSASHAYVMFVDSTSQEGWGVRWNALGTLIQGFTMTGGVETPTSLGTYTADAQNEIDLYFDGTTLYGSRDGATAVSLGTPPANNMRLRIFASPGGAAGKVMKVRNLLVRADWAD